MKEVRIGYAVTGCESGRHHSTPFEQVSPSRDLGRIRLILLLLLLLVLLMLLVLL